MSAPVRAPRCSEAAELRGDPRVGTGVPVQRWLLVEQPGPWGRDALTQSRLDPEVAAELAGRSRRSGARILLVRRHGRPGHHPQGRRHWALADSAPGAEALRWGRFGRDAELLDLPLTGPLPPAGPGNRAPHGAGPVYLVCAHARHDTCCAVRGRPVAAALERLAPGRVWECSHVGGCRFAANTVVLPHGLYYGGVDADSAPELVTATEAGDVLPGLLRGRSGVPAAVQAAEHHARRHLGGVRGRDALRPLATRDGADGAVVVTLEQVGTGRVLEVSLAQVPTAPAALLTCAASRETVPLGWQLRDLTEQRPA